MARRKLKSVLIANRGEIALRIIRTARAMGLKTIAVYSAADARSLHVAAADDARAIGPAEASQSYLNIDAIMKAAVESGADAIHPGYGFLSERPEFARAVHDAGLIFVGPSAQVMAALGDKVAARKLAIAAGVSVVPGIETGELAAARSFGDRAGYPILVKAAAGGGGRGMRVVASASALVEALEAASREARAAFGDGRVFIEKYLAHPRHVEIQLLGGADGNVVTLGERDCSIQRRHQKLIEESPAPGLSEATRGAMLDAAVRLARRAGYRNAGTAEFLLEDGKFYFLEVNARLQVEHPITEIRFGCDLVEEQFKIAMGANAPIHETPRGHTIECRINAEDAAAGFRPATGTVIDLHIPAGPGVRFDTHLCRGAEVTTFYDSLLGKLITFGEDREGARRRMAFALEELAILGVINTAAFLGDVIATDAYIRADLSTRFLEEQFPHGPEIDRRALDAALIGAALTASGGLAGSDLDSHLRIDRNDPAGRSPWEALRGFEPWVRR